MDDRVLRLIRKTRTVSKWETLEDLGRALAEIADGTLPALKAKDGLSAVLKRAREEIPKVSGVTGNALVFISIKGLASPLVAVKEPTLNEVLKNSGFEPYSGGRVIIKERNNREVLRRSGGAVSSIKE